MAWSSYCADDPDNGRRRNTEEGDDEWATDAFCMDEFRDEWDVGFYAQADYCEQNPNDETCTFEDGFNFWDDEDESFCEADEFPELCDDAFAGYEDAPEEEKQEFLDDINGLFAEDANPFGDFDGALFGSPDPDYGRATADSAQSTSLAALTKITAKLDQGKHSWVIEYESAKSASARSDDLYALFPHAQVVPPRKYVVQASSTSIIKAKKLQSVTRAFLFPSQGKRS